MPHGEWFVLEAGTGGFSLMNEEQASAAFPFQASTGKGQYRIDDLIKYNEVAERLGLTKSGIVVE